MERQLSTLSILHYVYGAFICLSGTAALIFVFIGGMFSSEAIDFGDEQPPAWLGNAFQLFGIGLFLLIELVGVFNILSGIWISRQRNRVGSMIVAAINCLSFPFGLALGIYTFVVLNDQKVRELFSPQQAYPVMRA